MKEFIEPFFFPHNLVLLGLLVASLRYRKKGLWLLLAFYYLAGNSIVANQVRHWYSPQISNYAVAPDSVVVLLGCGGTEHKLTACASARLQQLAQVLPNGGSVVITSRYCKPYVDYLLQLTDNLAINCFDGGENTYQEFNSLVAIAGLKPDYILTTDFHAWRVRQLIRYHGLTSKVLTSSSQTFRQLNCTISCLLTVNLTNYDLYSKLISEFASYAVFTLTRSWTDWYQVAQK